MQYSLEYMQTDDTFLLSALGSPDGTGCQRLREICEGRITTTQVSIFPTLACT